MTLKDECPNIKEDRHTKIVNWCIALIVEEVSSNERGPNLK